MSRANGERRGYVPFTTECSRGRSSSAWKEATKATVDCDCRHRIQGSGLMYYNFCYAFDLNVPHRQRREAWSVEQVRTSLPENRFISSQVDQNL